MNSSKPRYKHILRFWLIRLRCQPETSSRAAAERKHYPVLVKCWRLCRDCNNLDWWGWEITLRCLSLLEQTLDRTYRDPCPQVPKHRKDMGSLQFTLPVLSSLKLSSDNCLCVQCPQHALVFVFYSLTCSSHGF